MTTPWTKDGKVVTDTLGRILLCDHCPCGQWSGCGFGPCDVPQFLYLWYGRRPPHIGFVESHGPIRLEYVPSLSPSPDGGTLLMYLARIDGQTLQFFLDSLCRITVYANPVETTFFGETTLSVICDSIGLTSPCNLFDRLLYYGVTEDLSLHSPSPGHNLGWDWLYVTTTSVGLRLGSYNGCSTFAG